MGHSGRITLARPIEQTRAGRSKREEACCRSQHCNFAEKRSLIDEEILGRELSKIPLWGKGTV